MDKEFTYCDACEMWVHSDEAWLRDFAKCIASGRCTMNWDTCWYKIRNSDEGHGIGTVLASFMIGGHDRRGQVLREAAMERAGVSRVFRREVNGKSVFCIGSLFHEAECRYRPYLLENESAEVMAVEDLLEQLGNPWP